ncbi:MAG: M23 family metallopeptidase [Gemmatimonadota bacterium]|jgi:hypothetical protein
MTRLHSLPLLLVLALGGCDLASGPAEPQRFRLPVDAETGADVFFGFLPDNAADINVQHDYQCGVKARDGGVSTDLVLPSFVEMDAGVPVVAAASGAVVEAVDGHEDRYVSRDPFRPGNYVTLRHRGGFLTRYRHLRNGSVAVSPGQRVEVGALLGMVGSSGDSEWPHLSFEARTPEGQHFDPWAGPCSGGDSFWATQPEYPDRFALIAQGTTDRSITRATIAERPPVIRSVEAGAGIGFWIQVVNRPAGLFGLRLRDPTSTTVDSLFVHRRNPGPATAVYGGRLTFPTSSLPGEWAIDYFTGDGVFVTLPFEVTSPPAAASGAFGPGSLVAGAPVRIELIDDLESD